jgi:hypothetical protein
MERRFEYLRRMCISSIGRSRRKGDFISEELAAKEKSLLEGVPRVPQADNSEPIRRYYPNSIEEYRYLLALGNKTRSRTEQAKKLKTAESAVRFLQYVKTQGKFMEFLSQVDPETYRMVPIYANPAILKSIAIPKSDIAIPADPRAKS